MEAPVRYAPASARGSSVAAFVLAIALLALPGIARAECLSNSPTSRSCWCTGTIDSVYVTSGMGEVNVRASWRGIWVRICTLQTDKYCSAWLAQALTAQQTQKTAIIKYDFNPETVSYRECIDIPAYEWAPTPTYFRIDQ